MNDQTPLRRRPRVAGAVGLLAAGALSGGILAATLSASAATGTAASPSASSSSSSSSSDSATASAADGRGHFRVGGADPVRSDEQSVSADTAAKLQAAALEAVPGGTVYRVETDAGDAAYEAHMTKADGTPVTVTFDQNLAVTAVEDGMGKGDPRPADSSSGNSAGSASGSSSGSSSGASATPTN